jgi:hypothetical protein
MLYIAFGWLQVVGRVIVYKKQPCAQLKECVQDEAEISIYFTHNLQPAKSYSARNSHQKTVSVVPPEDGRLTPETCRGSRHNKVIVKVKVY